MAYRWLGGSHAQIIVGDAVIAPLGRGNLRADYRCGCLCFRLGCWGRKMICRKIGIILLRGHHDGILIGLFLCCGFRFRNVSVFRRFCFRDRFNGAQVGIVQGIFFQLVKEFLPGQNLVKQRKAWVKQGHFRVAQRKQFKGLGTEVHRIAQRQLCILLDR